MARKRTATSRERGNDAGKARAEEDGADGGEGEEVGGAAAASDLLEGECCVLTMARDERVFFPIWLRHYARSFAAHSIFVLDHATRDGSLDAGAPLAFGALGARVRRAADLVLAEEGGGGGGGGEAPFFRVAVEHPYFCPEHFRRRTVADAQVRFDAGHTSGRRPKKRTAS